MREFIKDGLLRSSVGALAYGKTQETWFDWTYRRRRERYEQATRGDLDAFRSDAALRRARKQIADRGHTIVPRPLNEIHTFAFLPSHWPHQNQIAEALTKVGPCTRFDYEAIGYKLTALRTRSPGHEARMKAMLDRMLDSLRRAHEQRPVDWFFSYALGWDMTADTLRRIQEEFGIPTVNVSLDDKNWWDEIERGDSRSGLRNIGPSFDLGWTSARSVVSWYWAEGGQAIFVPEGVNSAWFRPLPVEQTVDIGFVGNRFGYRPQILDHLRKAGLKVVTYGTGWPAGPLDDEAMLRFFNSCRINLGLGDMHYSRWMTNLKGRDFEIPSTGRGLYLTTFNADLASCFVVGNEIQCYRGVDELIELARHHLRNPEEGQAMASAARQRCLRDHQWTHRIAHILSGLGVLSPFSGDAARK